MKIGSRSLDRYVLVGLFNSALDVVLFSLLTLAVGLVPVVSNVISTVLVMTVSFFINRLWVFRSSARGLDAFARFAAVTLVSGWVVQSTVIVVFLALTDWLAPSLAAEILTPTAKVVAMGVGMVFNFVGYRWLFSHGVAVQQPAPDSPEQADDRRSPSEG